MCAYMTHVHTSFSLSIHRLINCLLELISWLLWNVLHQTKECRCFFWTCLIDVLTGIFSIVTMLNHRGFLKVFPYYFHNSHMICMSSVWLTLSPSTRRSVHMRKLRVDVIEVWNGSYEIMGVRKQGGRKCFVNPLL